MTDSNKIYPTYVPPKPASLGQKIGIGAALITIPVGSLCGYLYLKDADHRRNLRDEQATAVDLDTVQKIDPALLKYEQTGHIATGLKYARAVSIDAKGRILLAGDRKVRILDSSGTPLSEFAVSDYPSCIAAADDGTLYVGLRDHVETYSPDGKLLNTWKSLGDRSQLTGLLVTANEVYLADAGRRLIARCDFSGNVLGQFGQRDDEHGNPGLVVPSPFLNIRQSATGGILVSNPGRHRVETYTPDGELHGSFGQLGSNVTAFFGCCNPSQFAIMPDGRIITAEKGMGRVKIYHPDGRLDAVVAGSDILGSGKNGFELAVDRQNRILVLEPGAAEIRIFTLKPGLADPQSHVTTQGAL